jgi:hypothetical protein
VGKVKLPDFTWMCPLPLSSWDRQGSVAGVVTLTDFISSNNILDGVFEFYTLE